jgi:radical SAM superfamily enzyme YgiQ (UPF0313 family)
MDSLKVYLGDLTYDTVSISNPVFPLNIGFIASYCKSQFGNKVEIKLFKFINELYDEIEKNPPDILGLSNYAWNERIGLEIFRKLSEVSPESIRIFGGPNFPADLSSQEKFMFEHPLIDVYIPIEGEIGFSNVLERIFTSNSKSNFRDIIRNAPIEGCVNYDIDNNIHYSFNNNRINKLDEIPSPYLSGVMDKFFDGKLSPMFQTNRGCPFSCSYCVDGSDNVTKVNRFSQQRVKEELDYIGSHVPKNTNTMFISDLNFGMLPDDLKTCDAIVDIQKKYGFPKYIDCTTGKNSKEKIINAVRRLNGTLRLLMSVQSTDEQVLKNVRRDNISLDQIMDLAPVIKESGLRTTSEVILGMPGETYQSHVKTLRELLDAKMDDIQVYTCMMLNGAELNTPEQREKWKLKTKFRILPRDFAQLPNGNNIIEIEEVIVETKTLSFEEYVELRLLAFILFVTNIGVIFDPLLKFLRELKIDIFELIFRMSKNLQSSTKGIQEICQSYKNSTKDELWDSPEDIHDYYQDNEKFNMLIEGKEGKNVIQYHNALVTSDYMDDWINYAVFISKQLLIEAKLFHKFEKQFTEISNFCIGLGHNVLGEDRMSTNPKFTFTYDIENWLNHESKLNEFLLPIPKQVKFIFDQEQLTLVNNKLSLFGRTPIGKSQVIKNIPITMLWRKPVTESTIIQNTIKNEFVSK